MHRVVLCYSSLKKNKGKAIEKFCSTEPFDKVHQFIFKPALH